ncbi:uncharacterized protein ACMZJ9_022777 [Mantella aurantiaca]
MTDAVTYADLRFSDLEMKEIKHKEHEDDGSDHEDIMYENVETLNPPRFRDLPDPSDLPDSSKERKDSLISRFGKFLLIPAILFVLLLFITSIVMSVKYISESEELRRLSERFVEMNDSLSERLQSKEDLLTSTKEELETTQKRLELLVRGMDTQNASLLQCAGDRDTLQVQKEKAVKDQETAERSLSETKLRLTQMEQDVCPENWILIGKKCLLINNHMKKTWQESERTCLEMSANLLTVRSQDETLKSYLSNKGDYWLGKVIRWNRPDRWSAWKAEWNWPYEYGTRRAAKPGHPGERVQEVQKITPKR